MSIIFQKENRFNEETIYPSYASFKCLQNRKRCFDEDCYREKEKPKAGVT